jgi:hypothetical protein
MNGLKWDTKKSFWHNYRMLRGNKTLHFAHALLKQAIDVPKIMSKAMRKERSVMLSLAEHAIHMCDTIASFAEDIRLGTVSNKIIKMKTHTFYLGSIGNNTATLRVVYKAPVASIANGYLTGHLFLRPWCPYETKGQACQTPPGQYTGRYIVISLQSDDQKIKETTPINLYGDYQISLPAGKYVAKLAPSYIGVEQYLAKMKG